MKTNMLEEERPAALMRLPAVVTLSVVLFFIGCGGRAPRYREYHPDRIFPVKELQEDCAVLATTLREAHGNLYAHIDPSTFDKTAQRIKQTIDKPMTDIEFFRAVSPLVAAVHCGHTHIRPSRDFEAFYGNSMRVLPYILAVLQNRLIVTDEITPSGNIVRGSEILSINGRPTQTLIDMILSNMSGDGTIQTQKLEKLEQNFSWYLGLYSGLREGFRLLIRTPDGECRIIEKNGIDISLFRRIRGKLSPSSQSPLVEFKLKPDQRTALLRLKSFYTVALKKKGIRYKKYFRSLFRLIQEKKIENLIIDIRGNEGGSLYLGAELLSYLMNTEFPVLTRYQLSPKLNLTYRRHINRDLFISFKWLVTRKRGTLRIFPWYGLLKPQKPNRQMYFNGNVYVLIDGGTFSAAAIFAALLRRRNNTLFIGEETGGSICGNGVSPIHLVLPHTGLRVQIPFGYIKLPVPADVDCSRGVIPDYRVTRKSRDFLSVTDPVLEFVLRRIASRNSGSLSAGKQGP